jgi:hypothetical protein
VTLFLALREYKFLILLDLILQIVIDGRQLSIEHLEMLNRKIFDQSLNVLEVSFTVLQQPILMITVVPTSSYGGLETDAVFALL